MQFGQEGDYFLFLNYLAGILDKKELKKTGTVAFLKVAQNCHEVILFTVRLFFLPRVFFLLP